MSKEYADLFMIVLSFLDRHERKTGIRKMGYVVKAFKWEGSKCFEKKILFATQRFLD